MCGRMTQRTDPSEVARIFDSELRDPAAFADLGPRYNVAPTQPVTVVVQRDEGRLVELHRWGLVPAWSASPQAHGARLINARAESVATSGAFRTAFLRRRCVIPADGFYEWRREGRARRPFLIHRRDGGVLAFAGLWAPWRDPASGEWLISCAVVTTAANDTVAELHDRMPAILGDEEWRTWLDPTITDADLLRDLLHPADDPVLALRPVSPLVNSPHNEGPELVAEVVPVAPSTELTLFG